MKVTIEFHPRDLSDEDRAVLHRIIGETPSRGPIRVVGLDDVDPERAGGTSSEDEEPQLVEPDTYTAESEFKVGDRVKLIELGAWPKSPKVFVGATGTVRKIQQDTFGPRDALLISLEMDDPDPTAMHSAAVAGLAGRGWFVGPEHIEKIVDPIRRSDVRLMVGDRVRTEDRAGEVIFDDGHGNVSINFDGEIDWCCRYLDGRFGEHTPHLLDVIEVNGRKIVED